MSHFKYKTTKPFQFFIYVLNVISAGELIVNVDIQILETYSIGQL